MFSKMPKHSRALALGALLCATAAHADPGDPGAGPGISLLGQAGAAPEHAQAPGPSQPDSPWGRLPEVVRDDLFQAIRNQLDQPPRADEPPGGTGDPQPSNLAATMDPNYADLSSAYFTWRNNETLSKDKDTWPRYFFDHELDDDGRRILLTLHAKLKAEGIWDHLETFCRFAPAGATRAAFWAMPKMSMDRFQGFLRTLGYGDWYGASRPGRWGLRSFRVGAEFHVLAPSGDPRFVEMHIEIANPGRQPVEGAAVLGILDSDNPLGDASRLLEHGVEDNPTRLVPRSLASHLGQGWREWSEELEDALEERMRDGLADRVRAAVVAQGISVP